MPDASRGQTPGPAVPLAKAEGAFLALAAGDALGWPQEIRRNVRSDPSGTSSPRLELQTWTRRTRGRYRPYEETIGAGEYTDDTQLTLAVARSRTNHGADWWKASDPNPLSKSIRVLVWWLRTSAAPRHTPESGGAHRCSLDEEFRRRLRVFLDVRPKRPREIEEDMDLVPGQARKWLEQAEQDGEIERVPGRPVKFMLSRRSPSPEHSRNKGQS